MLVIDRENGHHRIKVFGTQQGEVYSTNLISHWPKELIQKLYDLKGEWFIDSYNRFEEPTYVQKQIDFVVDFYDLDLRGKKILDFGCGFGASSYCMAKRGADNIIGTELSWKNVEFANDMAQSLGLDGKMKFVGNILHNIEPASYDIIWFQAVLEHLWPWERSSYLKKLWSALKPGGHLIITETPNRYWPKETHTTGGKWLLPYLGDDWCFWLMRFYTEYSQWSDDDFYRSGIIGASHDDILNYLERSDDIVDLTIRPGYLKFLYSRASRKSPIKSILVNLADFFDWVPRKLLKKPVTAFLPFLNHIVLKRA